VPRHLSMTTQMYTPGQCVALNERFRGYLPVVVDVETGGLDELRNPLLEIAVVTIGMDETGKLFPDVEKSTHVAAFEGAEFNQKSLELNGIIPDSPLRAARAERDALTYVFQPVRQAVRDAGCTRAIMVGHNAAFDLKFLNAAVERAGVKRNPFHPFSCLDTVTLAGLAFGQTVLARSCSEAGLEWNTDEAHSAIYDTQMTAKLFCHVINRWEALHARA